MPPLGRSSDSEDDNKGGGSGGGDFGRNVNNVSNNPINMVDEKKNATTVTRIRIESISEDIDTLSDGGMKQQSTTGLQAEGGGVTSSGTAAGNNNNSSSATLLCASCDRCRARKTKCDGNRPCSNCIAKYMKKNKTTSIEGVPVECFECIYSLAKRRGPVPGKTNPSFPSPAGVGTSQSLRRSSADMVDIIDDSSDGEQKQQQRHQLQRSPSPEHHSNRMRSLHQQDILAPNKQGSMLLPRGAEGRMIMGSSGVANNVHGGSIDGADSLSDVHLTAALLHHAQQNFNQQQQFHNLQSQDNVYDKSPSSSVSLQHQLSMLQQMQQQQQEQRQFQSQQGKRLSLGVMNNRDRSRLKESTDAVNRRRKSVGDGISPSSTNFSSPLLLATAHLQQQQQELDALGGQNSTIAGAASSTTTVSESRTGDIGATATTLSNVAAAVANITNRNPRDIGSSSTSSYGLIGGVPRTVRLHTRLLDRNDVDGERLRSYYRLSIDEMFGLPVSPSDEEYCARSNVVGLTPRMIPGTHLAALSAVRFAEAALGAIVNNEILLGTELCNAVVHCLRESVQDPIQTPVLFEVAKSYFLLSVFRAFRGDMVRYFKYRRVCLNYVSKLPDKDDSFILLAAISYMDSWAYMIYNGDEKLVPDVEEFVPLPTQQHTPTLDSRRMNASGDISIFDIESKYNIRTDIQSIVCNPNNRNWIQGAPPIYLNIAAPARARVLDALACSMRTCSDQANKRFSDLTAATTIESSAGDFGTGVGIGPESVTDKHNTYQSNTPMVIDGDESRQRTQLLPPISTTQVSTIKTPTSIAVSAHEQELCSRNLVLSAFALMQHEDIINRGHMRHIGHHTIISALDSFLENNYDSLNGGFSERQVQSLLAVCNTIMECPFLLYHGGPTYHVVTNAVVLLGHFLNGMNSMKESQLFGTMETVMFEEIFDTYVAVRKLLTVHRRKLPVQLRCHSIPRPTITSKEDSKPLIDFSTTFLCVCRGCQGFVLMACSPVVAAERAEAAAARIQVAAEQEADAIEMMDVFDNSIDNNNSSGGGRTDTGAGDSSASGIVTIAVGGGGRRRNSNIDATTADHVSSFMEYNVDDDVLLGMISTLIKK